MSGNDLVTGSVRPQIAGKPKLKLTPKQVSVKAVVGSVIKGALSPLGVFAGCVQIEANEAIVASRLTWEDAAKSILINRCGASEQHVNDPKMKDRIAELAKKLQAANGNYAKPDEVFGNLTEWWNGIRGNVELVRTPFKCGEYQPVQPEPKPPTKKDLADIGKVRQGKAESVRIEKGKFDAPLTQGTIIISAELGIEYKSYCMDNEGNLAITISTAKDATLKKYSLSILDKQANKIYEGKVEVVKKRERIECHGPECFKPVPNKSRPCNTSQIMQGGMGGHDPGAENCSVVNGEVVWKKK